MTQIKNRIRMTDPQTWALHSLMCTVLRQFHGMDISEGRDDVNNVRVTFWINGDPTSYEIRQDGTTLAA